jgi:hypothetical protein
MEFRAAPHRCGRPQRGPSRPRRMRPGKTAGHCHSTSSKVCARRADLAVVALPRLRHVFVDERLMAHLRQGPSSACSNRAMLQSDMPGHMLRARHQSRHPHPPAEYRCACAYELQSRMLTSVRSCNPGMPSWIPHVSWSAVTPGRSMPRASSTAAMRLARISGTSLAWNAGLRACG